ncbi:MAG: hypothetical protein AM326_03185 [Candidatus Thorarchaeota archaeon SMTZ-45]|nr:MAG: hypothetical protein AM326_03185 [Candidatus Thorarchaeota archaeon SMTZ-45]
MNDNEFGEIGFQADKAKGLALKIILLLLVFIFPFIIVYLLQGHMIDLWGEPSPTNPFYLMVVGLLIVWFLIGYVFIIRRVGRQIDRRYGINRERAV